MTTVRVVLLTMTCAADATIAVKIHTGHSLQLIHQTATATTAVMWGRCVAGRTVLIVHRRWARRTPVRTVVRCIAWSTAIRTVVWWIRRSSVLLVLRRVARRSVVAMRWSMAVATANTTIAIEVHVCGFLDLVHHASAGTMPVTAVPYMQSISNFDEEAAKGTYLNRSLRRRSNPCQASFPLVS